MAKTGARKTRQSNFELLRIVAMLMIVAHHMVRFASPGLDALPLGAKWLYFFAIETGGEVGVDVFLIISVWFLAGRAQTLRSALRHVAKTEAIVLFYSLSLYVLSKYVLRLQGLPSRLALQSIAPTVTGLWWYITCYTLVVLVSPFLVKGLRSLGQSMHRQLVVVELVVVSVLPMLDVVDLYVNAYVSFLAIVVMVTYVRWYPPTLLERPAVPWLMLAAGLVASVLLGATVRLLAERGVPFMTKDPMYWEWSPGSPLVLCEAFGLFLVFSRLRLTNRAVNFLARSTVGVYLIHEHPGMRILLWQRLLPFEGIYGSGLFLPASVLAPVAIFVCCLAVDLGRRALFRAASRSVRGARGRLAPAASAAGASRPPEDDRSTSPRQETSRPESRQPSRPAEPSRPESR